MARLPAVGSDGETWGAILNEYLDEEHNADGTHKDLYARARVAVRTNTGSEIGARRRLNLIAGANVSITALDDALAEELDITIAAPLGGSFLHTQAVPAAVWTIAHNLGFYPNIAVLDSTNRVVHGRIDHVDLNTATVTFSGAFSGKATAS